MDELDKIATKHQEPYTLVCLYIRTLDATQREALDMSIDKYDRMRFGAKIMRSLVQQGLVIFDWEAMEASLTPEGIEKASVLVQEIFSRK